MRGAGRAFAPGFQATAPKACFSCPRAGNSARPLVRNPPFPLHFPHYVYHASYVCSIRRANSPFPRFFSRKSYQWRLRFAYTAGDEGAAARLAWNRMPRKPCCARLPGSGARTFAPLCGAKVTAFCRFQYNPVEEKGICLLSWCADSTLKFCIEYSQRAACIRSCRG